MGSAGTRMLPCLCAPHVYRLQLTWARLALTCQQDVVGMVVRHCTRHWGVFVTVLQGVQRTHITIWPVQRPSPKVATDLLRHLRAFPNSNRTHACSAQLKLPAPHRLLLLGCHHKFPLHQALPHPPARLALLTLLTAGWQPAAACQLRRVLLVAPTLRQPIAACCWCCRC